MKAYLSFCIAGIFAFDENKKLIAYRLFEKNPEKIAEKLSSLESGNSIAEKEQLLKQITEKGFKDIDEEKDNLASIFLKENFRKLALDLKFVGSENELNKLINDVALIKTKLKMKGIQRRDKLIIHAIFALSDLDKIINLVSQRLAEWYALHYPELQEEPAKLAEKIIKYGRRENFPEAEVSMGMELSDNDIEILKNYAEQLKNLYELRNNLERYLNDIVKKEMPNTYALLGALLSARLLSAAGSLEKLAKMPSSTIQLLGSEKALFRFLRAKGKKAKPPKYGLLFLSPYVSNAPAEAKGKVARLLASKLTLAIRYDFYSKEDHGPELKNDLEK